MANGAPTFNTGPFQEGQIAWTGSATWNPGSIADHEEEAVDITVAGVALGDLVSSVTFSLDVADLTLTADVTAADTVTCLLANSTAGAVNLSSGTVYVRVTARV